MTLYMYVLPQAGRFLSKQMHVHKVTAAHPLWKVQDPERANVFFFILLEIHSQENLFALVL